MTLLAEAMGGLGATLLPVAAALLFEELTFGGLVRLLIAPWPGARRHGAHGRGRKEHKHGDHPTNQGPVCGDPGKYGGGK